MQVNIAVPGSLWDEQFSGLNPLPRNWAVALDVPRCAEDDKRKPSNPAKTSKIMKLKVKLLASRFIYDFIFVFVPWILVPPSSCFFLILLDFLVSGKLRSAAKNQWRIRRFLIPSDPPGSPGTPSARPEWNDLRPPRFHSDAARLHPLRTGHGETTGPLPVWQDHLQKYHPTEN